MNALPDLMPPNIEEARRDPCPGHTAVLAQVNPLEHANWDALVAAHPDASFFHGKAWAQVLHDTYGHTPVYFCRTRGHQLEELLPVMEVSSSWTGRRGASLPFTDFCPPLSSLRAPKSGLFDAATEFGRTRRWKYFECRGGVRPCEGASPALTFYGHSLDLNRTEKALFNGLESAVRRGIRKSRKAAVQVTFDASAESMRDFYQLHCGTRRRHGVPPQPYRFFENILRHVIKRGHGWIASARIEGRTLAAAVFFHAGRQAIYKFGASDYAAQHLRPNNLLMWEAIKWYAGHGFDSLHFGRTSPANEGLRRFKLGFGATETRIEYYRYDFLKATFVTARDRAEGWFNSVFRALPPRLLRLSGEILYPHLS